MYVLPPSFLRFPQPSVGQLLPPAHNLRKGHLCRHRRRTRRSARRRRRIRSAKCRGQSAGITARKFGYASAGSKRIRRVKKRNRPANGPAAPLKNVRDNKQDDIRDDMRPEVQNAISPPAVRQRIAIRRRRRGAASLRKNSGDGADTGIAVSQVYSNQASSPVRTASLSKLGVKTPRPNCSSISRRLQKRPPSSSSLGTIGPS